MSANQEWVRKTQFSVNTSARVPNQLYERLTRYAKSHGMSKTDVINKALDAFLPMYVDMLPAVKEEPEEEEIKEQGGGGMWLY